MLMQCCCDRHERSRPPVLPFMDVGGSRVEERKEHERVECSKGYWKRESDDDWTPHAKIVGPLLEAIITWREGLLDAGLLLHHLPPSLYYFHVCCVTALSLHPIFPPLLLPSLYSSVSIRILPLLQKVLKTVSSGIKPVRTFGTTMSTRVNESFVSPLSLSLSLSHHHPVIICILPSVRWGSKEGIPSHPLAWTNDSLLNVAQVVQLRAVENVLLYYILIIIPMIGTLWIPMSRLWSSEREREREEEDAIEL